jgi:diacylglycerol kinase (ATP)
MSRLAVICNPRARSERRDPGLRDRFAALVGDAGEVHAPADLPALAALAARLRDDGCRTLALHGGDGTGHRVITALLDAWGPDDALPEVMWLHGGTNNTASRSMGQRGRADDQLRALVAAARGAPTLARTRRWPLRIEGRHHGFLWGIGIVERFIVAYEAGGQASVAGAAWTLARAVASAFVGGSFAASFFAPMELEIVSDGARWPDLRHRMVTAGAVDQIGLGFRPFRAMLDHPGQMHALGTASSPAGLALDLPRLFVGRPSRSPDVHERTCRRLIVRSASPLRYDLDGDLYEARTTELVIETTRPVTFLLAPGARPPPNRLGP